jgi:hypothetical protein
MYRRSGRPAGLRTVTAQVFDGHRVSPCYLLHGDAERAGEFLSLPRAGGEVARDDRFHLFDVEFRGGGKLCNADACRFQERCYRLRHGYFKNFTRGG